MFSEIAHEYIRDIVIQGKLHKSSLVVLTTLVAGLNMAARQEPLSFERATLHNE